MKTSDIVFSVRLHSIIGKTQTKANVIIHHINCVLELMEKEPQQGMDLGKNLWISCSKGSIEVCSKESLGHQKGVPKEMNPHAQRCSGENFNMCRY